MVLLLLFKAKVVDLSLFCLKDWEKRKKSAKSAKKSYFTIILCHFQNNLILLYLTQYSVERFELMKVAINVLETF